MLSALSPLKHGVDPESAVTHTHADVGLSHKLSNLSPGHGLGIHRSGHLNPRDVNVGSNSVPYFMNL